MAIDTVTHNAYYALNRQDLEILRCLGRGLDLASIGEQMRLPPVILINRCDEVCQKLGLQTHEQLRIWVLQRVALAGQVHAATNYGDQMLLQLG